MLAYRVGQEDRHCLTYDAGRDGSADQTRRATKRLRVQKNIHIHEESFGQPTPETQDQLTPKTLSTQRPPAIWTKIKTYMSGTER